MSFWLVLIPLISAFIGWLFNWIAIKMLFHPKKPRQILGITIQGIFPKRRQQFAIKLGQLVSNELLSFAEIERKISNPANVQKIMPLLETHIDLFLREKLPAQIPMLGLLIGDKTIEQVKGVFMKELEELFPAMIRQYMTNLQHDFDFEKVVIEKVSGFSSDRLEGALKQVMSSEFKLVGIIGGLIGFTIGLLQVLITLVTT